MGVGALHENPVVGQSIFNSVGYVISFTVSDSMYLERAAGFGGLTTGVGLSNKFTTRL